jgi:SPP1 gp7 family putative phage head morphogenesis protein
LYNCGCDECNTKAGQLNLALGDKFKPLLKTGEKAFKRLHEKGSYNPKDLQTEKAYKDLMDQTFDAFNFAITDNDIPDTMRAALQDDARLFGGLKTHAQLFEASKLLLDDKGNIKPFSQLSHEFNKLNVTYNKNYLEAEYEFAVGSSQMAAKWDEFSDNDRYELQYRTAGDNRVREEHAALSGITLPKSYPFWMQYMPPNGWNCRCTTVEVLKDKFPTSNSEKAIKAGEAATTQIGKDGKNRLEIFRFNPGAEKVVFPPAHPYTKVAGAKVVAKGITDNENKFIPIGIDKYEKKLGITVNKEIFSYLRKDTTFTQTNLEKRIRSKGAYYYPKDNYVKIPIDDRRKSSKWFAESIVYHEFGHAADFHNDFQKSDLVKSVMDTHREALSKNNNKLFKEKSIQANKLLHDSYYENDMDKHEKAGAISDTIMSLNYVFGSGHDVKYFKQKGNSEAEFIAHTFENKFAGNDLFKEVMPELYNDMIKLAEELKTKLK